MAAETWEQIESEIKDLWTLSVALHCMLASFFCDRLASSRAGNTAATRSKASHPQVLLLGTDPVGQSGHSKNSQSESSKHFARHDTKCFACINPFNNFMNPLQWILLLYTFYRWENWGMEKLGHLTKVPELESDRAGGFEPRQSGTLQNCQVAIMSYSLKSVTLRGWRGFLVWFCFWLKS